MINVSKLDAVYGVLDEVFSNEARRIVVAYSGGKDSTALSIMLYDWLRKRRINRVEIVFVNVDTMCEIPMVREWAVEFMETIVARFANIGIEATYRVLTPKPIDTPYWRILIRGYPAPSFKFRWCVELLKRKPSRSIVENNSNAILLLGHRDDESPARAGALKARLGICPLSAGRCISYYLQVEGDLRRVYPIRDLKMDEVWGFLRSKRGEFRLDRLFTLYGYNEFGGLVKARYGCWLCTLVKQQIGHYVLGGEYMFLEAGRLIYRWLSDIPWLRARKNVGYSKLGHLLLPARTIMFYIFKAIEELSGLRLYGLDEARIMGYSLREVLYELDAEESDKVIKIAEAGETGKERKCGARELRELCDRAIAAKAIEALRERAGCLKPLLLENPVEHVNKVLDRVEGKMM